MKTAKNNNFVECGWFYMVFSYQLMCSQDMFYFGISSKSPEGNISCYFINICFCLKGILSTLAKSWRGLCPPLQNHEGDFCKIMNWILSTLAKSWRVFVLPVVSTKWALFTWSFLSMGFFVWRGFCLTFLRFYCFRTIPQV